MLRDLETPPIGGGSYSQWVVFVIIVILSVYLGTFLFAVIGKGLR